jgi:hypothetical protein
LIAAAQWPNDAPSHGIAASVYGLLHQHAPFSTGEKQNGDNSSVSTMPVKVICRMLVAVAASMALA